MPTESAVLAPPSVRELRSRSRGVDWVTVGSGADCRARRLVTAV